MGEASAGIRLTLNTDGFRRGFGGAVDDVDRGSKRMGDSIQSNLESAAKGGFDALKSGFSQVKDLALSLGGILGGVGLGALVKGAIDSEQRFKQLATSIATGTGELVKWRDLQRQVQTAAKATNVSIDEMTLGFERAFKETGDLDFSVEALEAIGHVARQTGNDVEQVGRVAGVLSQKFQISSTEIGDALGIVVSAANKGGAPFEDLADDLGEIGGKAKSLGLEGSEGLRRMLGFVNLAKEEAGNFQQAMTAIPQIFDQILERTSGGLVTSGGKVPIKVAAVDAQGRERDPFDILQDIIKETGGDKTKLGEFGFGGEGLQAVLGLAKNFEAAMAATGGNIEEARNLVKVGLEEAGGDAEAFGLILEQAADKTEADKIQENITKLQMAFTKPEMMAALSKLAEVLPPVVDAFAKLAEFAIENPATTAGVLVGGQFGRGALPALLETAINRGGQNAGASMQQGIVGGADVFGSKVGQFQAAVGAFAAAAAAWSIALEQAGKLSDELEKHDKDLADERENALGNAERQGESFAIRERSSFDQVVNSIFGGDPNEYLIRGADGKPKAVSRAEATQHAIEDDTGYVGADGKPILASTAFKIPAQMRGGVEEPPIMGPPIQDSTKAVDEGKIATGTGRAVGEVISNAELRVRVVNADEIASKGSGTPGTPKPPGWVPRP